MNLSLQQALVLVLVALLTCFVISSMVKDTPDEVTATITKPNPNAPAPPFTGPSFVAAHHNNTLELRPGSKYTTDIMLEAPVPPAYTIKLLYKPGCTKHHLVMLFEHVAKQMQSDGTAASANIAFEREMIDPLAPCNLLGGFPKVLKIRRTGQVLEYTKNTDYGPFVDWVMNEQLLF